MQTSNHNKTIKDPQKVSNLLAKSTLRQLIEKAEWMIKLQQIFAEVLDQPELARHCSIMNINDKTLVIMVDQAAWATRLRYQQEHILRALQFRLPNLDLKSLQVKVRP